MDDRFGTYVSGQSDVILVQSFKRTLKRRKTKFPLGKHLDNLILTESSSGMGSSLKQIVAAKSPPTRRPLAP